MNSNSNCCSPSSLRRSQISRNLQRDVFDVVADFLQDGFLASDGWPPVKRSSAPVRNFVPVMDIAETKEEVVITAELPGLSREDFEVRWTEKGLLLSGQKKPEEITCKDGKYHFVERLYGSFERLIPLDPDHINIEKIRAEFENGILRVYVTKSISDRARERKIEIH
jgi:HSP20 family protein